MKSKMKTMKVSWDRFLKVERDAKEALRLASKHDPDLETRVTILECQLERLGAPQYRVIRKGKSKR